MIAHVTNFKHRILTQLPLNADRPGLYARGAQIGVKRVDGLPGERQDRESASSGERCRRGCQRCQLSTTGQAIKTDAAKTIVSGCRSTASFNKGVTYYSGVDPWVAKSNAVEVVEALASVSYGIAGTDDSFAVPWED